MVIEFIDKMNEDFLAGILLATMPIWIILLGVPMLYIIEYIEERIN